MFAGRSLVAIAAEAPLKWRDEEEDFPWGQMAMARAPARDESRGGVFESGDAS